MVVLLGILVGAELDWDGVGLKGVLGLDADEEGASAPGGNALAREVGRLEATGEGSLQLKMVEYFLEGVQFFSLLIPKQRSYICNRFPNT